MLHLPPGFQYIPPYGGVYVSAEITGVVPLADFLAIFGETAVVPRVGVALYPLVNAGMVVRGYPERLTPLQLLFLKTDKYISLLIMNQRITLCYLLFPLPPIYSTPRNEERGGAGISGKCLGSSSRVGTGRG